MPSLMQRRRALKQLITYIGLDVHKGTIAVALAEANKRNEVREYGKIANTPAAVKALVAKLARNGHALRFCYEAGPCGCGIQLQLTASKHDCIAVAPSLIPRRPGERIKTDRRDAINLAKLHRAGELTPVWVPDEAHEAIRDLVRARLAAVRTLRQARQQLSGFLLRHGHHYNRPAWTLMHRRWLAGLRFEHAVHHIVLEDCIAAVEAATARRDRLEAHIAAALPDWSLAMVVELSVPGEDQPRAVAAAGRSGQADPRYRVEGTGSTVPEVSQIGAGRKATDRGHRRNRARAGRLRLGNRQTGAAQTTLDVLMLAEHEARRSHRTNTHPKLGKAGGTSRSGRTLASTTSRISSDAGRQTEEAPRRITGPAVPSPRIRA